MSHDPSLLSHLLEMAPDLADLATAFVKHQTAEHVHLQGMLDEEMRNLFTSLVDNPFTLGWCRWGHNPV
jgi:hypothetical protein